MHEKGTAVGGDRRHEELVEVDVHETLVEGLHDLA
jgi:hypothetical protein